MTSRPVTTLVVGAGGLLGKAVVRASRARGDVVLRAAVRWGDRPLARTDLSEALRGAVEASSGGDWQVAWCAGAGVTSTTQEALDAELETLRTFVQELADLPAETLDRGVLFFASSAGAVFAGSHEPPFTERSVPSPLAPYGHAKLRSEQMLAETTAGAVRTVIGRISNIYGPGQNLAKQQGLVSRLCLAHHTATPIGVYVSLDTLRDYLFVDDCAGLVLDMMDRAREIPAGSAPVVKILASQQSVSIASLVGEVRRIFKKKPLVVLASSKQARQQARDLRFRSLVWPELDQRTLTPLVVGIAATGEDIGRELREHRDQ